MSEESLTVSPALYPLAIDRTADAVQFVRLSEEDYADASFLDARSLVGNVRLETRTWDNVRDAASGLGPRCDFIFHISHVGSTLLSRLLGCHPGIFSLREPAVLRNLAEVYLWLESPSCDWSVDKFDERLDVFLKLWSRTFRPEQTALLKATSFVSDLACLLLQRVPRARAILMYVKPAVFLRALLSGTLNDIKSSAPSRLMRLRRYLGATTFQQGTDLSVGECVAMSWLTEMLALERAKACSERVLWLDFDKFLQAPQQHLRTCFAHLGQEVSAEAAEHLCAGPILSRYAKAPQYEYNAALRSQRLAASEREFAVEIRRGMDWLNAVADSFPQVKSMLESVDSSG